MSAPVDVEIGLVEKKLWELNPSSKQKNKEIESQNIYSIRDEDVISDGEILSETTDEDENSTETSKGRMFFNRLIACLLAVSLLWMTSLQVTVYFLYIHMLFDRID
jgi:hypothetical protein